MSSANGNGHYEQDDDDEKVIVPLDRSETWWARQKNAVNVSFDRLSKEDQERFFQQEEMRNWSKMKKNCIDRRAELMKYSESSISMQCILLDAKAAD